MSAMTKNNSFLGPENTRRTHARLFALDQELCVRVVFVSRPTGIGLQGVAVGIDTPAGSSKRLGPGCIQQRSLVILHK